MVSLRDVDSRRRDVADIEIECSCLAVWQTHLPRLSGSVYCLQRMGVRIGVHSRAYMIAAVLWALANPPAGLKELPLFQLAVNFRREAPRKHVQVAAA